MAEGKGKSKRHGKSKKVREDRRSGRLKKGWR